MSTIIISIVIAWIVSSALLVTIVCMHNSRLNKIDEPFKDPAEIAEMRRKQRASWDRDQQND